MKRQLIRILALALVLLLLIPSLSGCAKIGNLATTFKLNKLEEGHRAKALLGEIGKSMDELTSLTLTSTVDLSLKTAAQQILAGGTGTTVISRENDSFAEHSEVTSTIYTKQGGSSTTSTSTLVEGFRDGKMYHKEIDQYDKRTAYSADMTAEEYLQYRALCTDVSMLTEDVLSDCSKRTCVQNEDETWSASYSAFKGKALQTLTLLIADLAAAFAPDSPIKDVEIVLAADKDFRLQSMEMVFLFDKAPVLDLSLTMSVEVSDIDSSSPKTESLTGYTDIEGFHYAPLIKSALNKHRFADKGSFVLTCTQTMMVGPSYRGQDTFAYAGDYKNTDNKLTFDVEYETGEDRYNYVYDGKDLTAPTFEGDETVSTKLSSCAARLVLDEWLDPTQFDFSSIEKIKKKDKFAEYTAHLGISRDLVEGLALRAGLGNNLGDYSAKLTVTISDDRITSYFLVIGFDVTTRGTTYSVATQINISFELEEISSILEIFG
ncbi:MAG: hypothetical protein E7663_04540 [Ruminococcaceae bacterium]|nr:hypothetical protein [Oscillospiraceae bacterium]